MDNCLFSFILQRTRSILSNTFPSLDDTQPKKHGKFLLLLTSTRYNLFQQCHYLGSSRNRLLSFVTVFQNVDKFVADYGHCDAYVRRSKKLAFPDILVNNGRKTFSPFSYITVFRSYQKHQCHLYQGDMLLILLKCPKHRVR